MQIDSNSNKKRSCIDFLQLKLRKNRINRKRKKQRKLREMISNVRVNSSLLNTLQAVRKCVNKPENIVCCE